MSMKRGRERKGEEGGLKGDSGGGNADKSCEFHEHGFLNSGENDYTIVVVPEACYVFTASGAYDTSS